MKLLRYMIMVEEDGKTTSWYDFKEGGPYVKDNDEEIDAIDKLREEARQKAGGEKYPKKKQHYELMAQAIVVPKRRGEWNRLSNILFEWYRNAPKHTQIELKRFADAVHK